MAKNRTSKPTLKEQFAAMKNLPQFFQMIWETSKSMTIANVILRVLRSSIPLIMLYVGKLIIDEVIRLSVLSAEERELQYLWTIVGIELALVVVSDIMNRGITLLDSLLGDLFSNKTSERLIRHAAKLDLYQFEDATFYDKLERARRQTVTRVVLMSQILAQFQDIITIMFLAAGLLTFSPWLLVILAIAVIPSFMGETHFNGRSYSLSRSWTPERRELDYLRFIGASDQTAKEIKIFDLSEFIATRFRLLADKYYHENRKLATKRALWGSVLSSIGALAYYGAYVYILLQAVAALITIGTLTFLAGSFKRMQDMMQGIMRRFSQIAESALYLQDLFDFLAIKPSIDNNQKGKRVPKEIKQGFVFENVGFRYFGSERWVIRNMNFHLKAGEKLALVGENGAGKTTLVKLLARLYEPTEGRILLDGVDIKEYNLAEYRQATGIIFQDFVRFQMAANDNIAIGQITEKDNSDKIEASAVKSLANTVIDKLPNGFDQVLGKRFSGGVELSGGEWQKIALARAYMRNAQLLILDEPTSALDARAEHEVFIRFSELIQGKSAVLISHRFSTVRMADRILFLENGRKKELGTHEELLAKNGKYAELFNLQAQGYLG